MQVSVNLRHLAADNVHLEGQLTPAEIDLEIHDEIIQVTEPLHYKMEVEKLEEGLLLQGELHLRLRCQCVRCLKSFDYPLDLESWTRHVPLEGEEAAPVLNDCVDLTPYLREDILLEFPQHPLCDQECRGLQKAGKSKKSVGAGQTEASSSAWAELNKLKLNN